MSCKDKTVENYTSCEAVCANLVVIADVGLQPEGPAIVEAASSSLSTMSGGVSSRRSSSTPSGGDSSAGWTCRRDAGHSGGGDGEREMSKGGGGGGGDGDELTPLEYASVMGRARAPTTSTRC